MRVPSPVPAARSFLRKSAAPALPRSNRISPAPTTASGPEAKKVSVSANLSESTDIAAHHNPKNADEHRRELFYLQPPPSLHRHNRLDHTRLRFRVGLEHVNQVREIRLVRNPGPRIDLTLLDQLDNPREIRRQRIARSHQSKLPSMHHGRMRKSNLLLRDSHIHDPTSERRVVQRLPH